MPAAIAEVIRWGAVQAHEIVMAKCRATAALKFTFGWKSAHRKLRFKRISW
jgi:hypothetical protein